MTTRTVTGAAVTPYKLAHIVLRVHNLQRSIDWYSTVLGARVAVLGPGFGAITYDEEHHRIGLLEVPGDDIVAAETFGASELITGDTERKASKAADSMQFSTQPGLEHVAFTFVGLDDLLNTYVRLRGQDIVPLVAVNHGPTVSFYYTDPDGNRVELQIDTMPMDMAQEFLDSPEGQANVVGVLLDPEELLRRYEAGEPVRELVTWAAWQEREPAPTGS